MRVNAISTNDVISAINSNYYQTNNPIFSGHHQHRALQLLKNFESDPNMIFNNVIETRSPISRFRSIDFYSKACNNAEVEIEKINNSLSKIKSTHNSYNSDLLKFTYFGLFSVSVGFFGYYLINHYSY